MQGSLQTRRSVLAQFGRPSPEQRAGDGGLASFTAEQAPWTAGAAAWTACSPGGVPGAHSAPAWNRDTAPLPQSLWPALP